MTINSRLQALIMFERLEARHRLFDDRHSSRVDRTSGFKPAG
jgi:hypothetical protein